MAAGKHRAYRDHKFRESELGIEISRSRFYYSKEEFGCDREHENGEGHGIERRRDSRVRTRVRQRDIKEREVENGEYHSSSSTSDSGFSGNVQIKQHGYSVRVADREPGELSSGSGSDDPDVSESHVRDNDSSKSRIGVWSEHEKRRKFSPIVWDREEKQVSDSSRNKANSPSLLPPLPPPPIPQSPCLSSYYNLKKVVPPSAGLNNLDRLDSSPNKLQGVWGLVGSSAAELPIVVSSASSPEKGLCNDQEAGQLDGEKSAPTRNISSSRWANENNYPKDEDEISAEQRWKKRRKMPLTEAMGSRSSIKAPSPELGKLIREGSEGAQSKSSGSSSGDGCRIKAANENEIEQHRNDCMEVDKEDENGDGTAQSANTDYEGECEPGGSPEIVVPRKRCINMLQGCRNVKEFEKLNKINEGTYGVVYRARDTKSGEIVALKKVKMEKEREGFPLTSLREINILLSFHHPSVVDVKEVVMGSNLDSIFMVMEYMEHDLKGLMEMMKQPFSQSEVKCLMLQLLEGIKYLHDNWVLHRDLKTSNILLNNCGELKICDFGMARQYGSPLKPYTHLVVTLWYRAPELLLGGKEYSTAIDMWSLGCIMAELLAKEPLFSGKNEIDQLDKIFKTLGTPNEKIWQGFSKLPGAKVNYSKQPYNRLREKFPPTSFSGRPTLSEAGFDLLNKLLTYDPEKRIGADEALNHEWFREVPLPKSKEFMPTFPSQHAEDRHLRRFMRSPDPLEEQRRKELKQGELLGTGGLFD